MNIDFSNYIVYVDESGDHSLEHINTEYPVFVLAFCIFNKRQYVNQITPAIQHFKFKYFGHDILVLHEHEIRKAENSFSILINQEKRIMFLNDLTQLIEASPFAVISVGIRKDKLRKNFDDPANPYHLALGHGLNSIFDFMQEQDKPIKRTHIIFESRGKKEDRDLELEFRRFCDGRSGFSPMPFEMIIANKQINSCGLQLADLIARPIGRYILNPKQENRAYEIIEKKFYGYESGSMNYKGLKCYP